MSQLSLGPVVPARAQRFREAAFAAIKTSLLDGRLRPHEPLVEEQIAGLLAISRTPVREALAILEHEGLIAPRAGRGLYVRPLSRAEFQALFIANEAVEPFLVRQAAARGTRTQIAALQAALEQATLAVEQQTPVAFLAASRAFHQLIGEASGNEPLTTFVVRNEERADMYLIGTGQTITPESMRASNQEHAAILAAITRRDPEQAARLTIYHAQSLRQRFGELFTDEGASHDHTLS